MDDVLTIMGWLVLLTMMVGIARQLSDQKKVFSGGQRKVQSFNGWM
jgi:hypothetical protein